MSIEIAVQAMTRAPNPGHDGRLGDYASAIGWFRRGTSERVAWILMPMT